MGKDTEKYESLIQHSPLFSIDKQSEPNTYKSEAVKMVGYLYQYLLSINESKYGDYGLEIAETANACIKNYNSEYGEFLHYFNAAMAQNFKRAHARKEENDIRSGIVITNEDQKLIRKILKIADEKGLDTNSDSFYEVVSGATGLSVGRVWELIQINHNTATIPEFLAVGDEEEISIFDMEPFAVSLPDRLEREEEVIAVLDMVETVFLDRQDRQKPLLSKLITAKISIEVDPPFLPYLQSKAFFDEDIWMRSIEWGVPVSSREIAAEMGLLESSVSRTAKQFFNLLKEKLKYE